MIPNQGAVTQLLEKHGIAVFLLVAGGYVVTTSVVNPMVETSKQFVSDIKAANEALRTEINMVEKENLSRWDRSFALHTEKRDLILKLDDEIDALARDMDKLRGDITNLRTLFLKPFPIGDNRVPAETPGEEGGYAPEASR